MKLFLKRLIRRIVIKTPLPEVLGKSRSLQHITVLAYHKIGELPGDDYPFDPELISATPEEFDREVRYVKRHYDPLTLKQLLAGMKTPSELPARPALITFDDGYQDNFLHAYPILKREKVSALIFLTTGLIGTRCIPWWDKAACCFKRSKAKMIASPFGVGDPPYNCSKEHLEAELFRYQETMKLQEWPKVLEVLEQLEEATQVDPCDYLSDPLFLTWTQIREMHGNGIEFGGHTRTHPILSHITDPEILQDEIVGCAKDIKTNLMEAPLGFAYPEGSEQAMSEAADVMIQRAGFQVTFSYLEGTTPRNPVSLQRLPRIHTEFGDDFGAFRLALALARTPLT